MFNSFIKNWIFPPAIFNAINKSGIKKIVSHKHETFNELLERNKQLKDRHLGKRCFILAAGSSVKQQDLRKLKGEYVLSVSNTFVHKDFPEFRPQYHILPSLIMGHSSFFTKDKFVEWLEEIDKNIFDAEIFLHIGDMEMVEANNLLLNRKINWVDYIKRSEDFNYPIDLGKVPNLWTVSELAIIVALHLGFESIYLIGFDHDWFSDYGYFYDLNKEHKMKPRTASQNKFDSEHQMRVFASVFKNYKYLYSLKRNIFNANANKKTYVDVFPKVDFDELFQ